MLFALLIACGVESTLKPLGDNAPAPTDTGAAPAPPTDTAGFGGGADSPGGSDGAGPSDDGSPDDGGSSDGGSSDGGAGDDGGGDGTVDTAPPDTGTPEDPSPSVDPCADAPEIDCPVDVLDPSPCASGVAAWLSSGSTHSTVQAALDDALPGDTVAICPGTWSGGLTVSTRGLILRGYGPTSTVLDGAGVGSTLTVSAPDVTVADLGVTGGSTAGSGGGILGQGGALRLCALDIAGNTAAYEGGGVYHSGGTLEVSGGTIDANTAGYQGGGIAAAASTAILVGPSFSDNAANYAGGGLFADTAGSLALYDATFTDNRTGYEGGAIAFNGSFAGPGACIVDTTFTANFADYAGGALSSNGWGSMSYSYERCTFSANTASVIGGAIAYQQWGTDLSVTVSSSFLGNVANIYGGAISLTGGWGLLDASFYDTTFDANRAGAEGGAIHAGGVGTEVVRLTDSAVTANTAGRAGAIAIDVTSTVEVTNVDFGAASTDNAPDDIPGFSGWGAGASFRCATGVCL